MSLSPATDDDYDDDDDNDDNTFSACGTYLCVDELFPVGSEPLDQ